MASRTRRKAEDGIAGARAAFVAGVREGDAAAAASVYAEDARLVPPATGLVRGRHAIFAFWQAGLDAGIRNVELDVLELERHGTVAFEIGSYVLRLQPDEGSPVVDRGIYLLVHEQQQDGSWRWAVEMFNPYAPRAATGEPVAGGCNAIATLQAEAGGVAEPGTPPGAASPEKREDGR